MVIEERPPISHHAICEEIVDMKNSMPLTGKGHLLSLTSAKEFQVESP